MKRLKQFAAAVLYWFLALNIFHVFRYFGLPEQNGVELSSNALKLNDNFLPLSMLGGFIFGSFYFIIELITSTPRFKRKSFGQALVIRALLYLIVLLFTTNVLVAVAENLLSVDIVTEPIIRTRFFWSFVLYFTMMSSLYSFFEIVSEKFGRGVLMKMLLGSYRSPKEENRIFMFLNTSFVIN